MSRTAFNRWVSLFIVFALRDLDIVFVQSNARKLEQKLQRGEIDAMVGLLPVNLKNDFSDVLVTPLALNRAILVAGQEHQFTMERDLAGRRVILQRGDTYIPKMLDMGCTVVQADSITNALNRLEGGEAEAYIASSVEMAFHIVQSKKYKNIRVMGGSLERIPMVMMVGRQSGLLERMTSALVHLEESGEVESLRSKWLGRSLYVPGIWELYRYHILCTAALLFCVFLATVTWIYALKRQVRKVSRRLIRSERKYRDLIEESPDIILLLDADRKPTAAWNALWSLFRRRARFAGKSPWPRVRNRNWCWRSTSSWPTWRPRPTPYAS